MCCAFRLFRGKRTYQVPYDPDPDVDHQSRVTRSWRKKLEGERESQARVYILRIIYAIFLRVEWTRNNNTQSHKGGKFNNDSGQCSRTKRHLTHTVFYSQDSAHAFQIFVSGDTLIQSRFNWPVNVHSNITQVSKWSRFITTGLNVSSSWTTAICCWRMLVKLVQQCSTCFPIHSPGVRIQVQNEDWLHILLLDECMYACAIFSPIALAGVSSGHLFISVAGTNKSTFRRQACLISQRWTLTMKLKSLYRISNKPSSKNINVRKREFRLSSNCCPLSFCADHFVVFSKATLKDSANREVSRSAVYSHGIASMQSARPPCK